MTSRLFNPFWVLFSLSAAFVVAEIESRNIRNVDDLQRSRTRNTAIERRQDLRLDLASRNILNDAWLYRFPPWHEPFNPQPSNLIISEFPVKERVKGPFLLTDQSRGSSTRSSSIAFPSQSLLSLNTASNLQGTSGSLDTSLQSVGSDTTAIENARGVSSGRQSTEDFSGPPPHLQDFTFDLPSFPNLFHNIIRVPKFDPLPLERHETLRSGRAQPGQTFRQEFSTGNEGRLHFPIEPLVFSESRATKRTVFPGPTRAVRRPIFIQSEFNDQQIRPRADENIHQTSHLRQASLPHKIKPRAIFSSGGISDVVKESLDRPISFGSSDNSPIISQKSPDDEIEVKSNADVSSETSSNKEKPGDEEQDFPTGIRDVIDTPGQNRSLRSVLLQNIIRMMNPFSRWRL